ncbi:MAG: hypothetical protein ACLVJB_09830 [Christensenellales bacterium]
MRATLKVDGPCVVQYPKDGIVPYAQNVTGEPPTVGSGDADSGGQTR